MLGQPYRLPRRPHQRHDGEGLQEGAARRDLRPDRPAVHAVQHAVPVAGRTSRHSPDLLDAADCLLFMPDFIHWALCGSRVAEFTIASTSQCLQPADAQLGDRPAEEVRPAHAHLPEGRPARHQARRAAPRRRGPDRPAQGQRGRPARARHRLRRRRRAHRQHRQGQLGLPQLRHLVADGRRGQEGLAVRRAPRS